MCPTVVLKKVSINPVLQSMPYPKNTISSSYQHRALARERLLGERPSSGVYNTIPLALLRLSVCRLSHGKGKWRPTLSLGSEQVRRFSYHSGTN